MRLERIVRARFPEDRTALRSALFDYVEGFDNPDASKNDSGTAARSTTSKTLPHNNPCPPNRVNPVGPRDEFAGRSVRPDPAFRDGARPLWSPERAVMTSKQFSRSDAARVRREEVFAVSDRQANGDRSFGRPARGRTASTRCG